MGSLWSCMFGGKKQLTLVSTTVQVRSVDLIQKPNTLEREGSGERTEHIFTNQTVLKSPREDTCTSGYRCNSSGVDEPAADPQDYLQISVCSPLPHSK